MATGDLAHSRTPMINLKDHALSFTFPEIAQEVRAHFERQLQIILPELQRSEERPDCWRNWSPDPPRQHRRNGARQVIHFACETAPLP